MMFPNSISTNFALPKGLRNGSPPLFSISKILLPDKLAAKLRRFALAINSRPPVSRSHATTPLEVPVSSRPSSVKLVPPRISSPSILSLVVFRPVCISQTWVAPERGSKPPSKAATSRPSGLNATSPVPDFSKPESSSSSMLSASCPIHKPPATATDHCKKPAIR